MYAKREKTYNLLSKHFSTKTTTIITNLRERKIKQKKTKTKKN